MPQSPTFIPPVGCSAGSCRPPKGRERDFGSDLDDVSGLGIRAGQRCPRPSQRAVTSPGGVRHSLHALVLRRPERSRRDGEDPR